MIHGLERSDCYVVMIIIINFFTDGSDGANKAPSEDKCVEQMNETEEDFVV